MKVKHQGEEKYLKQMKRKERSDGEIKNTKKIKRKTKMREIWRKREAKEITQKE
jgi:hypothetical protein